MPVVSNNKDGDGGVNEDIDDVGKADIDFVLLINHLYYSLIYFLMP
jgi:hypothetical protein